MEAQPALEIVQPIFSFVYEAGVSNVESTL